MRSYLLTIFLSTSFIIKINPKCTYFNLFLTILSINQQLANYFQYMCQIRQKTNSSYSDTFHQDTHNESVATINFPYTPQQKIIDKRLDVAEQRLRKLSTFMQKTRTYEDTPQSKVIISCKKSKSKKPTVQEYTNQEIEKLKQRIQLKNKIISQLQAKINATKESFLDQQAIFLQKEIKLLEHINNLEDQLQNYEQYKSQFLSKMTENNKSIEQQKAQLKKDLQQCISHINILYVQVQQKNSLKNCLTWAMNNLINLLKLTKTWGQLLNRSENTHMPATAVMVKEQLQIRTPQFSKKLQEALQIRSTFQLSKQSSENDITNRSSLRNLSGKKCIEKQNWEPNSACQRNSEQKIIKASSKKVMTERKVFTILSKAKNSQDIEKQDLYRLIFSQAQLIEQATKIQTNQNSQLPFFKDISL